MSISFVQLRQTEPSAVARRLLWHVFSVGRVWRDEPEVHPVPDKSGVFLFCVVSGSGALLQSGKRWELCAGPRCWLIDTRQPRTYPKPCDLRLTSAVLADCCSLVIILGYSPQRSLSHSAAYNSPPLTKRKSSPGMLSVYFNYRNFQRSGICKSLPRLTGWTSGEVWHIRVVNESHSFKSQLLFVFETTFLYVAGVGAVRG